MVDVTCHVDTAASTQSYKILRSKDTIAANYIVVGSVLAGTTTPIIYNDLNVKTDEQSYYYKVVNVDSCGFDGMVTNIGRTILIKAMGHSNYTNTIIWNDYENWLGNVMSYNIYRGIDGIFDPVPIANIPFSGAGINSFTDDIYTEVDGHGVFSYYIEALEGMGNMYGFSENSISNIAEAYQEPQVFVPNAFKPGGVNNVFKPVTTYVNISDYELTIFNRWSDKVFSTTDQEVGWDGTHNGKKSEIGVYVYLLKFKTSRGEYIEKNGVVTLIR
jgi:gliding motility-associated-like protein